MRISPTCSSPSANKPQEHDSGVVFLIDEVQFLEAPGFEALIAAIHETVTAAADHAGQHGLPQLPRLAGEAESFAKRLFQVPADRPTLRRPGARRAGGAGEELGIDLRAGRAYPGSRRLRRGVSIFSAGVRERALKPGQGVEVAPRTSTPGHGRSQARWRFLPGPGRASSELEQRYLRAMAELGAEPQRAET